MNNLLNNYINMLLEKQNDVLDNKQKNLFSYEEYENILSEVDNMINSNPDLDIKDYHNILFNNSNILDYVKEIIIDKDYANNFIISYGTNHLKDTISVGNTNKDSIIDLASVTKLFTGITILDLSRKGLLDLNKELSYYTNEFPNISHVKLYDLLTFNMPLKTNNRIDKKENTSTDAYNELKNIEVFNEFDKQNPYTDMGIIILKYVIEKVTNMPYYTYLNEYILKPLKMTSTIVDTTGKTVIPTGNTLYMYENSSVLTTDNEGRPFDPKAQVLKKDASDLPGHAGLFSSTTDMLLLAKGLSNNMILNEEIIRNISKNETGGKYILNSSKPMLNYLGKMSYSKNPWISESEVHPALGGKTIASAGFTGNKFVTDMQNDISLFMSANRTNERALYVADQNKVIEDNGRKFVIYDGKEYTITNRYSWISSKISNEAVKLALQYSYLEYLYDLNREDEINQNISR